MLNGKGVIYEFHLPGLSHCPWFFSAVDELIESYVFNVSVISLSRKFLLFSALETVH